jgi:hypothetical protein
LQPEPELLFGEVALVAIVGSGLLAFGLVMILTLVADLVVGTVVPERAGAASALMETCSEFGGALGIAVLGSICAAVYASRLSAHLPGQVSHVLLSTARGAFTDGLNVVAWVGAAVLVAAAATTVALLRRAD